MAAAALALMSPLLAQDTADYPDLEAIPIENPRSAQRVFWRGDDVLLIRFDGAISNVGGGPLELRGDPRTNADGVEVQAGEIGHLQQMVETGGTFFDIGVDYPVIFENTDGHNHWHADKVMAYELWSEDKTTKIDDGSKVGFCLVDSDQRQGWTTDWYYGLAAGNPEWQNPAQDPGDVPGWGIYYWCGNAMPDIEDLRMGVTEGWRDTYDGYTNLQWLDVSDVEPGDYYVATIADPLRLIAETDETGNNGYDENPGDGGKVWSDAPVTVPGYVAQDTALNAYGETTLPMPTTVFGSPGAVEYTLVTAPTNGVFTAGGVAVAAGDTFTVDPVFTPDPGFSGVVAFDFYASDSSSEFPWTPTVATVTLNAEGGPEIDNPGAQNHTVGDVVSLQISAVGSGLSYAATGLPASLTINPTTGLISGTTTTAGGTMAVVEVSDANVTNSVTFTWTVDSPANSTPVIANPGDQYSNLGANVSLAIVASDDDGDELDYAASGLPSGLSIDATTGVVSGSPTSLGDNTVTVTVSDDTVSAEAVFDWSIQAAPNEAPTVASPGFQVSIPGTSASVQIQASDPNADALTYSADNLPPGLTIDAASGLVSGVTEISELEGKALFTVTVTVSDGAASDSTSFDWAVVEPFDDVGVGHTFYVDVAWMVAEEVTFGCGNNMFCPADPLTRAQTASFFARALGLLDGADADQFSDDDTSVHEPNIDRIAAIGITQGCAPGLFCPDLLVTRAQVASFIVRAYGLVDGAGADLFIDDDGSVHEANIDRLATAGITLGCDTGRFCPDDLITRGQFAALLHRAAEAAGS